MSTPTKAVAVVNEELTPAELTAFLQANGWAEKSSGESVARMKLEGSMLTTSDGGMYINNPKNPKVPAMTVRIVKPLEEYWAIYLSEANAALMGRSDIGNTFSKKYLQPDAARKVWDSDEAFDQIKASIGTQGLVDNYGKPLKPSWKGDLLVQIVPDDGQMKGDETPYILSLSTTSVIEFKGASKSPEKGVVSDFNFMQKLCQYAMDSSEDRSREALQRTITQALTSYTLGGVVAEVRIMKAENKDMGTNWSVIVFDPVHVEPMFENDLLPDGTEN